jgi:hypothetical protein
MRIGCIAVAVSSTLACGATFVAVDPQGPPIGAEPGATPGGGEPQPRRLRLVREERLPAGEIGAVSLAVDPDGIPHLALTTRMPTRYSLSYWTRDAEGAWQKTPDIVPGAAQGVIDIDRAGRPLLLAWHEPSSTTQVWELGPERRRIDALEYTQIYQVLRSQGELVGMLGHFGGNLYLSTREDGEWRRDYFRTYGTYPNRPPGVVTPEGSIAVLSGLTFSHFGGQTELLDSETRRKPQPVAPAVGGDGSIWVLRNEKYEWEFGNSLLLQRRVDASWMTPEVLVRDAPVPTVDKCPAELGAPCQFAVGGHIAAGLLVLGDRPIPIALRTTRLAYYERECIERDPNFQGCGLPPCIDEGGPAGPWIDQARRGAC